MATAKWKRALLPSLGSRRKDDVATPSRSRVPISNTVSDMQTTTTGQVTAESAASPPAAIDVDERLISDLLETTAGNDINSRDTDSGVPAQSRKFIRSHTVGAVSSSDALDLSSSSQKAHVAGRQAPQIPHKSSRRDLRSAARDASTSSPGGNTNGLVRPLSTSESISSRFLGRPIRRLTQSPSSAGVANTGRRKGDSPIRKGSTSPNKISHSVSSVLASQDFLSSAADSADSGGLARNTRSKARLVFAKFADVVTEHFTTKSARKSDKVTETTAKGDSETVTQQIVHGLPLDRLSLNPQCLDSQMTKSLRPAFLAEDGEIEDQKARRVLGRSDRGSMTARKRLTVVDELDFKNGQALEDPFSESSSGQHTTEFEARLRSRQSNRGGPTPTDPFQAEHILDSSVDAMLLTPPVAFSTPRRRPSSMPRSETPTKASRGQSDVTNDLVSSPPGGVFVKSKLQRKNPNIRMDLHKENQKLKGSGRQGLIAKANSVSSDSTRLSSFPPGSTIRRVPRSVARLKETPMLPAPAVERGKGLPLRRKKHPSPCKGQLELFGKVMEKNLALGVFKDVDELGMSFSSPRANTRTPSPRDTNRMMRSTADSNTDLRKEYTHQGARAGVPKSRSRIPQPVRQLSRSRTDTAFARDFMPPNKGDSTAGDELQWSASTYQIGHRCNHCGSTNQKN